MRNEIMSVHGIDLEVLRGGTGQPIILLHGFQPIDPQARFVALLSHHGQVIASWALN